MANDASLHKRSPVNKSNPYKGCLEPIILKLLRENKRMYGYEMTRKVKEITRGELQITEGALYPLLHRLEAEGLVVTEIENIGNRVRKYYSLTKAGQRNMEVNMEEIRKFLQAMNHIMKPKLA